MNVLFSTYAYKMVLPQYYFVDFFLFKETELRKRTFLGKAFLVFYHHKNETCLSSTLIIAYY